VCEFLQKALFPEVFKCKLGGCGDGGYGVLLGGAEGIWGAGVGGSTLHKFQTITNTPLSNNLGQRDLRKISLLERYNAFRK
jgi:hypothetical protein